MKTLPVLDRTGSRLVEHRFDGRLWPVAQPVTFTPFASARACSARCVFCSETLWHKDSRILSASLRPGPGYFEGLGAVLDALRGLPLGISLSGLEATDDADWLCRVLDMIDARSGTAGGLVLEEKVLYSNGAGLARETTGARLLPRLREFGLTRVEASRHHHTQAGNDAVMRFRPGKPIRALEVFERTVGDILGHVPVRLVCVVQKGGVEDFSQVAAYLEWARGLGARDVVFREFSRLHDLYRPGASQRAIEGRRIPVSALRDAALQWGEFEAVERTEGYYYWNERFLWKGEILATFEASDYELMKARHGSGVVHKLIYHANGNLCGDWDPEKTVLMRGHALIAKKDSVQLPT